MTKGKTTLIQKDPSKRTAPNNYRLITCLPMMWKILTAQIREEIYYSLTSRKLFPDEQKRCCKGSRGRAELLYIDKHILNESKNRRKNLAMAWIDNIKGIWYGSAKLDSKLSQNVQNVTRNHKLHRKKKHEKLESWINSRREKLGWNKDPKRDFPRRCTIHNCHDATKPHTQKIRGQYKLSRSQEKNNHLMYMDDIKLFAKNEKELETLIHTVRIYSQDIGMEFGIEKCALLVIKSGKRHLTDGIELPNKDKIRTLAENETYKYLGILEADTIEQVEMKNKIQKEYLRRTRKLLETKLSSRNLIKGINTCAVPLVRYLELFLRWTREKLRQMDQRTRKLMTMNKAFDPRDDVDRLYEPRKEGGRGLSRVEDSVNTSIQRLEDYIEKHERGLITTIKNNTDNTIDNRMTKTRKQKMGRKTTPWAF